MVDKSNEPNLKDSDDENEIDEFKIKPEIVKCRFYRNRMPQKEDVVAVVTTDIQDFSANVRLIEYDDIEGFITFSNVTSKRIKAVQRLLKIGK